MSSKVLKKKTKETQKKQSLSCWGHMNTFPQKMSEDLPMGSRLWVWTNIELFLFLSNLTLIQFSVRSNFSSLQRTNSASLFTRKTDSCLLLQASLECFLGEQAVGL